jgi:hypothetical protein
MTMENVPFCYDEIFDLLLKRKFGQVETILDSNSINIELCFHEFCTNINYRDFLKGNERSLYFGVLDKVVTEYKNYLNLNAKIQNEYDFEISRGYILQQQLAEEL